jgi:transcription-repair coupling factor (superfamily II helicase)
VNLLSKLPPSEFLVKSFLKLHNKMKISTDKLAEFLVHNGFTRSSSSIDSGEFSVRGEIVDIILPGPKLTISLKFLLTFMRVLINVLLLNNID